MPKQTPFYSVHQKYGAKITEFAGYEMPVQYSSIKEEHLAVREKAGIFDVSHMGEFFVEGSEALDLVQYIITNDASKLDDGQALYTVMCRPNGGIIDDLLVYKLSGQRFMLVVNAANREKDLKWITDNNSFNASVKDHSDDTCLLAIQGPEALPILQELSSVKLDGIKFYHFTTGDIAGFDDVIISATGYTGEKGFELYFDKAKADPVKVWEAIMDKGKSRGIAPAGLGARDTLRLEMGLALYGNDLTEETNPIEARLGWLTKLGKDKFIGQDALKKVKEEGAQRKLYGFEVTDGKSVPRHGHQILDADGNSVIGTVTSGTRSISLNTNIGMGYVDIAYAKEDQDIKIQVRKRTVSAKTKKPPFLKK